MQTIYANPAGYSGPVIVKFKINRAARIRFNLLEDGIPISDTTGWTWELFLKKNKGDRLKIYSLTLGNGLRYEIYSDYTLIADISIANNTIEEGEYYIELVRTDLAKTWVEGNAIYTF